MKGIDAIFSRKSDEWITPQDFFDELDKKYHFDMDVASTKENAKCRIFFTKEEDGLDQKWAGNVWCNPPYSKVGKWIQKASEEMENGVTTVMLVPSRTDTRWFHDYVYRKPGIDIEFIKGRMRFSGATGNAPFPNMLIVFKGKDKT